MRYFIIFFAIFFQTSLYAQDKCMVFCFDMLNGNKSIDNSIIERKQLSKIGFTFSFLNCGRKNIVVNASPAMRLDYSDKKVYDDFGNSTILIRVLKKINISYYPFSYEAPPASMNVKEEKKLKTIKPGAHYLINDAIYTDYFRSLPVGEYEITLDYVDKLNTPQNSSGISTTVDTALLAKYYEQGVKPSAGYYLQYSKNKIYFTVVD